MGSRITSELARLLNERKIMKRKLAKTWFSKRLKRPRLICRMHRTRFKLTNSNGLQFKVTDPCFIAYEHYFSKKATERKAITLCC